MRAFLLAGGIRRGLWPFLCVWVCAALAVRGAAAPALPEAPLAASAAPLTALLPQSWMLDAGVDAMNSGLPAMAESFLTQVLAKPEALTKEDRERAALALSAAQLSLRQFPDAKATLARWVNLDNPAARLRVALMDYQEGDIKAAGQTLSAFKMDALPPPERSWWLLLEGLIRESEGQTALAEKSFESARAAAATSVDRALFDTAISRAKILSGTATPAMVEVLRKKVEENKSTRMEAQFAKELAVLLSQLGRKDESLAVLQGQIDSLGPDARDEKDQMRLLYALIDGEYTSQAREALQDILKGKGNREIQQNALYMLARSPQWRMEPDGFLNFLSETLAQTPDHGLSDEMLLMIAQINLDFGRLDAAEAAAAKLLSDYPASTGKNRALRLLAQIAMRRDPPRYRVAADYLNRLRGELPEGAGRAQLSLLLADLYFLNADYANANALYAELMKLENPPLSRGELLFREVLSAVRAEKLDEAAAQLDNALKLGGIDAENQWRARWSLLQALQENGRSKEALERLRRLLASDGDGKIPTSLRLRLLWLEAQLTLATGRTQEAPVLAQKLVLMVDSLPEKAVSKEDRVRVLTNALLLEGQALLAGGKTDAAAKAFARLRADYPDTDPAMLSYFVEARHLAADGLLADAQQRVMRVAEKYPKNNYAPAALYEAAVLAEGQGTVAAYEQATALLDSIVRLYPDSKYVFFARLRQGDLARKLNDFGAALIVYDSLLASHPDHPERARVEMARADTYLALSAKDLSKYGAAEGAFERLFALPDLSPDTRVEAGFKWGFALERAGNLAGARQAYWLVISRFLRDNGAPKLEETGRYWMARCVLQLGDLLTGQGNLSDARTVYALVGEYALPGAKVARSRLDVAPASGAPASAAAPQK